MTPEESAREFFGCKVSLDVHHSLLHGRGCSYFPGGEFGCVPLAALIRSERARAAGIARAKFHDVKWGSENTDRYLAMRDAGIAIARAIEQEG